MSVISLIFVSSIICAQESGKDLTRKPDETIKPTETEKNENFDPILKDKFWIKSFHETISDSVYQSAVWFDNFFIEEGSVQEEPKTNARIGLGWKPKSRNLNNFETRFRIKVKLPNLKDKVDFTLSDQDETEQNQLPLESLTTRPEIKENKFSAAISYIHTKNKKKLTDSKIGISSGGLFVRARHKRTFTWNNEQGFSLEPSVFYFINDGLGARLLLEYNYQYNDQTQYRVNYSARGSNSFSGIRWKHGLYMLNQLNENTASVIGFQAQGERNGERGFVTDNYSVNYRYRFSALQKWLFFEIEPFLEWPEDINYKATLGIAFRVEGYFYKG